MARSSHVLVDEFGADAADAVDQHRHRIIARAGEVELRHGYLDARRGREVARRRVGRLDDAPRAVADDHLDDARVAMPEPGAVEPQARFVAGAITVSPVRFGAS